MPKSRRFKEIPLTKTGKKNNKHSQVEKIQDAVEKYSHVYVLEVENFRNDQMAAMRRKWKNSKFFMSKNALMKVAIGQDPSSEIRPNMHHLSEYLFKGRVLFFTWSGPEEIVNFFSNYSVPEFARTGFVATEEFIIPEGPLDKNQFGHSMEPTLRMLGLPTHLNVGIIEVERDYVVCEVGEVLTPEKAKLLKLWGVKMANFQFNVVVYWSNDKITEVPQITQEQTMEI